MQSVVGKSVTARAGASLATRKERELHPGSGNRERTGSEPGSKTTKPTLTKGLPSARVYLKGL